MRFFVAAAVVLALLAAPAHAQGRGKKHDTDQKPDEKKVKVDEKAYKSALDRLPNQKDSFDPWQNVRDKPSGK